MNIEKAIEEFIKYTENYNLDGPRIEGKQKHSIRVMEISKEIAQGLRLTLEEIDIATLIGLLHDIARFEQYTQYHTFKDAQSIDHGDLGVEILNKDIRKYIETDKYDETIKLAVKNHNKYKIQEGLTQKQELFAKMIRDADKIDILYESAEMFWKGRESEIEEATISEEVFEQISKNTQVKVETRKTPIDDVVSVIAFIFDINFKVSFEILKKENYINRILDRYDIKNIETKRKVENIRDIANQYIERKIKESE